MNEAFCKSMIYYIYYSSKLIYFLIVPKVPSLSQTYYTVVCKITHTFTIVVFQYISDNKSSLII